MVQFSILAEDASRRNDYRPGSLVHHPKYDFAGEIGHRLGLGRASVFFLLFSLPRLSKVLDLASRKLSQTPKYFVPYALNWAYIEKSKFIRLPKQLSP